MGQIAYRPRFLPRIAVGFFGVDAAGVVGAGLLAVVAAVFQRLTGPIRLAFPAKAVP